jgi:hypothetical protein
MDEDAETANAADPDSTWLYRVGCISALVLGVAYISIIPLYAHVGAPPSSGEAWLKYLSGKITVWWAILGLSVLTDLLFVPVALSLYLALKRCGQGLFVDLSGEGSKMPPNERCS